MEKEGDEMGAELKKRVWIRGTKRYFRMKLD